MTPIPLMVELCAGTAALSLRHHPDRAHRPVLAGGEATGATQAQWREALTPMGARVVSDGAGDALWMARGL